LLVRSGNAEELCKINRGGSDRRCASRSRRHRIADAPASICRIDGATEAAFELTRSRTGPLRRLTTRRWGRRVENVVGLRRRRTGSCTSSLGLGELEVIVSIERRSSISVFPRRWRSRRRGRIAAMVAEAAGRRRVRNLSNAVVGLRRLTGGVLIVPFLFR